VEDYLTRKGKGSRGVVSVGRSLGGGPWVDFATMAVRRGIPALELPRNCSGFSKANVTL
jgi:hypothetical protein